VKFKRRRKSKKIKKKEGKLMVDIMKEGSYRDAFRNIKKDWLFEVKGLYMHRSGVNKKPKKLIKSKKN
jgi:hypothetical protein